MWWLVIVVPVVLLATLIMAAEAAWPFNKGPYRRRAGR